MSEIALNGTVHGNITYVECVDNVHEIFCEYRQMLYVQNKSVRT